MSFPRPNKVRSSHAPTSGLRLARQLRVEVQAMLKQQAVFRVVGALQEAFGWPEAECWLNTPRQELDGKSPLEAIMAGEEKKVEEIVERLRPVMSPL